MASQMEVDEVPGADSQGLDQHSNLKRSNSAPMINLLMNTGPVLPVLKRSVDDSNYPLNKNSMETTPLLLPVSQPGFRPIEVPKLRAARTRHCSMSSLVNHSSSNHSHNQSISSTPVKMSASRIHQLRCEEEVNKNIHREIKHERETQSAMQISTSWHELTIRSDNPPDPHKGRPRSLSESLHIFTSGFPAASSPSPTRVGKQCFSPSMQTPVIFSGQGFNFTPSPSPSPTRRTVRRSVSPIVLKPSALGKRKYDGDNTDSGFSQPKRIFSPGGLLAQATLIHNASGLAQSWNPSQMSANANIRSNSATHCTSLNSMGECSNASDSPTVSACSYRSDEPNRSEFTFTPLSDSAQNTDSECDMFDQTPTLGGK